MSLLDTVTTSTTDRTGRPSQCGASSDFASRLYKPHELGSRSSSRHIALFAHLGETHQTPKVTLASDSVGSTLLALVVTRHRTVWARGVELGLHADRRTGRVRCSDVVTLVLALTTTDRTSTAARDLSRLANDAHTTHWRCECSEIEGLVLHSASSPLRARCDFVNFGSRFYKPVASVSASRHDTSPIVTHMDHHDTHCTALHYDTHRTARASQ